MLVASLLRLQSQLVLEAVDKVLKGLIEILNVTAFIGLVGGLALKLFLEMIEPHMKRMADRCKELMRDVNTSVDAYEPNVFRSP